MENTEIPKNYGTDRYQNERVLKRKLKLLSLIPLYLYYMYICIYAGRSQWLRGLRRGSAATRFLGLWF
jgi:hypothetical protein